MASGLVPSLFSGSSDLGSSPDQDYCAVLLNKTPCTSIPEILLVASFSRNRDKFRPSSCGDSSTSTLPGRHEALLNVSRDWHLSFPLAYETVLRCMHGLDILPVNVISSLLS